MSTTLHGAESPSDAPEPSVETQLSRQEQKKRRQVTVACNECRKRKVKCDGSRPSCSPCYARDLPCHYEADPDATPIVALKRKYDMLQRQAQDSEEMLEMLRTRPEREAIAILQRIRSSDLATALSMVRDGDLLIPQRPPSPGGSSNLLPPLASMTANRPVSGNWSTASIPPMERALADPFFTPERFASRNSSRSRFDPKFDNDASRPNTANSSRTPQPAPSIPLTASADDQAWAPRRRHNPTEPPLYDARLRHVQASRWTSVVVKDHLFANIISTYLTWDHPPWRLFDEDMFLDDLVAGRTTYCSRLLVNAILAYGCQNHRAIARDEQPDKEILGTFFFVEAKQLWHLEEGTESLPCIAAAGLLHGLHSSRGKDKVGFAYLVQGVRMAKDMGLFRRKTAAEVFDVSQPDLCRSRAAIAWGLYSYTVIHSMNMHLDSLLTTPPPVPIPDPFYTASDLQMPRELDKWHISKTFKALCELSIVVKDFLPLYYNGVEPEDIDTTSLTENITRIYQRLLGWAETIPKELKPDQDALPHILILHMQYHCVIAELFRPFVGEMPQIPPLIATDFPSQAAIASMEHLRFLVYLYVSRYNGPPVSVSMLGSLICVTFAAIRRLDNPEWRFCFEMCIKFLGEMVDYFPVARFILQGIYHSAERTRTLLPPEARSVFEYYDGALHKVRMDEVESSYPVDLNLSQTDDQGSRLSNLIKGTDDMNLDDN